MLSVYYWLVANAAQRCARAQIQTWFCYPWTVHWFFNICLIKQSNTHWGFVLKMRSFTRSGRFVWKYSPLSECCNDNQACCNNSRHCHPLLERVGWQASFSFTLSYTLLRPTSVLAGIDIFAHRPGADRRGQRGGDICWSEHGINSSQGQWHPAHSCFPSPSSFF